MLLPAATAGRLYTNFSRLFLTDSVSDEVKFEVLAPYYYEKAQFGKERQLLLELAEGGHPEAQYNLGVLLEQSKGGEVDDKEAVHWLQRAQEQGEAKAAGLLGFLFEKGRGVPADCQQAVKYYQIAMANNDSEAMYLMALMYGRGDCVDKDYSKVVSLLKKEELQGHAEAQRLLGYCYEKGFGVGRDVNLARDIYWELAEDNNVKAQVDLAVLLLNEDPEGNNAKALMWLKRAADQGSVDAVHLLDRIESLDLK